jgi:hypothetical protein
MGRIAIVGRRRAGCWLIKTAFTAEQAGQKRFGSATL